MLYFHATRTQHNIVVNLMTLCFFIAHNSFNNYYTDIRHLYNCMLFGSHFTDADSDSKSSAHRSDYVFGSRKRRRVPPLPYSSEYDGYPTDTSKAPKLSASAPVRTYTCSFHE